MISEAGIVKKLAAHSDGYIGDDAAVLPSETDQHYVVSKDLLVEDVHFNVVQISVENLAHKSLQVNLSDLAAMGAKPQFVLCGIAIPERLQSYAESFLLHLVDSCKKSNVILIGGDTTGATDKLVISITAIGSTDTLSYRSTAKHSEIICVAGELGYAHLGWKGSSHKRYFLAPEAKVEEGIWLAKQVCVTSMMDVSDGLYVGLSRLCHSSGVAAVVELDRFQFDKAYMAACEQLPVDPEETALIGGEDYSLLLTVQKDKYDRLNNRFRMEFGYSLKRVGYTDQGSGVSFHREGELVRLDLKPFSHFGEESAL